MKGRTKVFLALLGLAVFIAAGVITYPVFRERYEFDRMRPLETGEVIPGVYAIRNDFVNFYLMDVGGGYIAFDAGLDVDESKVALGGLGIDPALVWAVFLTHRDYDHVGGLELFTNAALYLSKEEGRTPFDLPYTPLGDGATIEVGDKTVVFLYAPGHTPDSGCYLVDGYLFTGDNMSLAQGEVSLFNPYFNVDDRLQEESLLRLSSLDAVTHLFTGHYGYSDDFSDAFALWR